MRIKENKTRTKSLSHSVSILTQIAEYRIENDKTNETNDKKKHWYWEHKGKKLKRKTIICYCYNTENAR